MRTSPVHYIAPSSISITPNANGSADDLAVYVARSARIKVYSRGSLQTQDATYQQWKLSGRNRRLAESDVPYTIYARLPKGDKETGYLVFAPKQLTVSGWIDKYPYLTLDGLATGTAGHDTGSNWYVRLGEVSLPENGSRTVTLDTGILGTDQFNAEWNLDPDDAPLRVSIRCTIDGEDAGQTPYVPWERKLLLQATLVEGWDTGAASRLDHWTIARNTDDASLDPDWPDEERRRTFADTGEIELSHRRGPADDFNQAVSASYLVTAWGTTEDDPDGEVVALAYTTVSIMAETVEKYDLEVSTSLVTYSQASGTYRPAGGVRVGIRATDQKGNATKVTRGQLITAGLHVSYSHQDEEDWTPLVFDNPVEDPAEAVIPTDAFSEKKSIVIRLTNTSGMELSLFTVAFMIETDDASELYLSRLHDDKAHGFIGFLKGVWFGVKDWFIDENGNANFHNLTVAGVLDAIKGYIDDLRSHNFQSGLLDGAGFRLTNDNGEGSSELEVDFLKVRKKATFMELEIREETFVGGNNHYSPAGSIIYKVEYMDENDQPIGYTIRKVPFLLKRFAFLGRVFNYAARKRILHQLSPAEWAQVHHFRCYLLADDGTTATRNWWKVGDQPRCQTFNKAISAQNKRDNLYNWKKDHFSDDPSTPMPDKTIIEGPFETAYYWRLVSNVGSEKLDDGHAYDFIDMPYEGWGGYSETDKRSFRDGGSGIPVAGDTIVCIGNRTDESRMNVVSLYTSGSDNHPPAIKGYRGIHTFSFENTLVWEMSPEQFLVKAKSFKLFDDTGYEFPVPLERGEWQHGARYHWYDRTSWKGCIWLCQVLDIYVWENATGTEYQQWQVENIEYGEGNFEYSTVIGSDEIVHGTDHYYARGTVGGQTVYKIKLYTYSEPDKNNDLWLREVDKGRNGMDGDGVEFVYIRTATNQAPYITSSSDSYGGKTYLDDDYLPLSSAGRCTDDPSGVTKQLPYEWVIKRTMADPDGESGERIWHKYGEGQYEGRMSLWATYSENTIRLDISNEMDMIHTTSALLIDTARTVETIVQLYDGSTEVDISAATMSVSGGPSSTIATFSQAASGRGWKLSWAFKAGQTMAAAYNITISYTYKNEAHTAVFTVSASKGEPVWQLKPSLSAIPFQRNSDNTLTPASRAVGLSLVKIDGGSTATYTSVQTGLTVRYSTSSMPSSASAGTGWSSGNITVANTADNLYIAMFNASGTLLDRETIPVVKDGEKGASSFTSHVFKRQNSQPSAPSGGSYSSPVPSGWSDGIPDGSAMVWMSTRIFSSDGQAPQQSAWTTPRQMTDTADFDVEFSSVASPNPPSGHPNTNTQWSNTSSSSTIWMATSEYHNGTWSDWQVAKIKGEKGDKGDQGNKGDKGDKGDQGSAGHVGRWYYFAGEWDAGTSYLFEATKAPYVKRGNNFYMLDCAAWASTQQSSATYTSRGQDPASYNSGNPWSPMTAVFKYIITEAMFTQNAYLGSFIINNDWMISQHGTVNGAASTNYTAFDPNHPNDNTGSNFIPNFAVDGKTGTSYQKKGYIGGFAIGAKDLTNTAYDASVTIQNAASNPTQIARIGKNAIDEMTRLSCSLQAESRKSGTYNTALYLKASGATYNYAFHGEGNGVLDGLVFGFKTKFLSVAGAGDQLYQIDLNEGSTIVLKGSHSSGNVAIAMPKLSNVRQCLGLPSNSSTAFAIEINIINLSAYGYTYLSFRGDTHTGTTLGADYPYWMSPDDTVWGHFVELSRGDYMKFMLIYSEVAGSSSMEYRAYMLIERT